MKRKQYPYMPKFIDKYIGKYPLSLRSSWELKFAQWLDYNELVIKWSYERHAIPYYNPIYKDYKRYFPDFYAKIKNNNGYTEYIIEIKPKKETVPPKKTNKQSKKTKLYQEATYLTNQAKFEAARVYTKKMRMSFKIITEIELFKENK